VTRLRQVLKCVERVRVTAWMYTHKIRPSRSDIIQQHRKIVSNFYALGIGGTSTMLYIGVKCTGERRCTVRYVSIHCCRHI
jgi:hypothetical protein